MPSLPVVCALLLVPQDPPSFEGAWRTSFGPMRLEQADGRVSGTYGFADELAIEGAVADGVLTFEAREPNGTSRGSLELWPDGETFTGTFRFESGAERFWGGYRSGKPLPRPRPGEVTVGQSASGLNLHLRAPRGWDGEEARTAVALFHGSNTSARAYLDTVVAAWPELAEEFLLVGIDGERLSPLSEEGRRAFNYTYVNFSGPDVGRPWRRRESPALVAEALEELAGGLPVRRWIVGGHSQGGFLTWTLVMFYPELVAGAFPASCNLIVQCEPDYAYFTERPELQDAQRAVAVAVVHGRRDEVVPFSGGEYGYRAMQDGGFPALRLFAPDDVGHQFAWLPVDEAVRWLDAMASEEPLVLARLAETELGAGRHRCATAAVLRAEAAPGGDAEDVRTICERVTAAVDRAARGEVRELLVAIQANANGDWVERFWEFRRRFHFTPAAGPVIGAYAKLREAHAGPADELFRAARREEDEAVREEKYREIVERYYASKWYPLVRGWVE